MGINFDVSLERRTSAALFRTAYRYRGFVVALLGLWLANIGAYAISRGCMAESQSVNASLSCTLLDSTN